MHNYVLQPRAWLHAQRLQQLHNAWHRTHAPHSNILLQAGAECSTSDLPDDFPIKCLDLTVLSSWCTCADETYAADGHTLCKLLFDDLRRQIRKRSRYCGPVSGMTWQQEAC